MNEQQYIKGFNSGYLIARDRPALAKQLMNGTQSQDNEYAQAVLAGIKQYAQEKVLDRQLEFRGRMEERQQDREQDQGNDLHR